MPNQFYLLILAPAGNYGLIVLVLAVYALYARRIPSRLERLLNYLYLLESQIPCFLSPWDSSLEDSPLSTALVRCLTKEFLLFHNLTQTPAPEQMQIGDTTITQKSLYITLFVIGIPLLLWASPLGTFFWLVGASSFVILFHAALIEPGIESEYSSVEAGNGV